MATSLAVPWTSARLPGAGAGWRLVAQPDANSRIEVVTDANGSFPVERFVLAAKPAAPPSNSWLVPLTVQKIAFRPTDPANNAMFVTANGVNRGGATNLEAIMGAMRTLGLPVAGVAGFGIGSGGSVKADSQSINFVVIPSEGVSVGRTVTMLLAKGELGTVAEPMPFVVSEANANQSIRVRLVLTSNDERLIARLNASNGRLAATVAEAIGAQKPDQLRAATIRAALSAQMLKPFNEALGADSVREIIIDLVP